MRLANIEPRKLTQVTLGLTLFITVFIIFGTFFSCKEDQRAKGLGQNVNEWMVKFHEFYRAFEDYDTKKSYNYDYNSERVGAERKIFPDRFSDLINYGEPDKRRYLRSKIAWDDFQKYVTVVVNDYGFFEKKDIQLDSFIAQTTVVLIKDVKSEDGSNVRVSLTYGGNVFAAHFSVGDRAKGP